MAKQKMKRITAALLAVLAVTPMALAAAPAAEEPPVGEAAAPAQTDDWARILVNPWHPLPEDFQVELKTLPSGLRVDARIVDDLNAMLADCRKAGLDPRICSAYRTQATQTRLYRNKIARLQAAGYSREAAVAEAGRWVAVPGTSEHQTGLALDLVAASYQVLDERQEETAEQQWLMEHSWEYGFILRYPSEKSTLTGIGYEPWHYRYVGRATAAELHRTGLCLEEYLRPAELADTAGTPAEAPARSADGTDGGPADASTL